MSWRDRIPRPFEDGITGKQIRALILVGFILGAVGVPAAGALAGWLSDPVQQSGDVTYSAADGPRVTLQGDYNFSGSSVFQDSETIDWTSEQGNITLSSQGRTNVTVDQIKGEWTNTSNLDVSGANLTINPEDKRQAGVGGDADRFMFRDYRVDDGTADLVYGGASGSTTLILYGLPSDTAIILRDTASGDVLGGGTTSNTGVLRVTGLPNSNHTVELQTSDGDPEFDAATASPTGDQSTAPSELSINVSDPDMPGETVTVDFYHKNESESSYELVGSDSRSTAGEVSTTIDGANLSSGSHEWYVVAEDEAGQTHQSKKFEFGIADELRFYNESNPGELLDNTSITATIYADDRVFNRSTTNGTIPLRGLPAGTELVITADADGFYSRHIVIEELAEQQSVYLLPENASSVEVRFKIEDKTGEYPKESTEVIVKRPITVNGSTTYQVVAADEAGVNGFTTNLEEGVRYRLVVRNDDGDERVLGAYTASVSETVVLTIGQLDFGANSDDDVYQWGASWKNASGTESVRFNFSDPTNSTENLHVEIYPRGNESAAILDSTFDGPYGTLGVSELVPENKSGTTWVVEWSASRDDTTINGRRVVGPDAGSPGVPLAGMWKSVASVGMLLVFGGLFGGIRADLGAVIVSLLGGLLWWLGWMPAAVGAGAVVLALAVATFYYAANRRP